MDCHSFANSTYAVANGTPLSFTRATSFLHQSSLLRPMQLGMGISSSGMLYTPSASSLSDSHPWIIQTHDGHSMTDRPLLHSARVLWLTVIVTEPWHVELAALLQTLQLHMNVTVPTGQLPTGRLSCHILVQFQCAHSSLEFCCASAMHCKPVHMRRTHTMSLASVSLSIISSQTPTTLQQSSLKCGRASRLNYASVLTLYRTTVCLKRVRQLSRSCPRRT